MNTTFPNKRKNSKKVLFFWLLLIVFVSSFLTSNAFAAEAHGSQESVSLGTLLFHLKYYWINFIVYVAGLYFLLSKAWPGLASGRRDAMQKAINEGQAKLNRAKVLLEQAEKRAANLNQETKSIISIINEESKNLSDVKVASATEAAKRLMTQTIEKVSIERMALSRWFKKMLLEGAKTKVEDTLSKNSSELSDKYCKKAVSVVKDLMQ